MKCILQKFCKDSNAFVVKDHGVAALAILQETLINLAQSTLFLKTRQDLVI